MQKDNWPIASSAARPASRPPEPRRSPPPIAANPLPLPPPTPAEHAAPVSKPAGTPIREEAVMEIAGKKRPLAQSSPPQSVAKTARELVGSTPHVEPHPATSQALGQSSPHERPTVVRTRYGLLAIDYFRPQPPPAEVATPSSQQHGSTTVHTPYGTAVIDYFRPQPPPASSPQSSPSAGSLAVNAPQGAYVVDHAPKLPEAFGLQAASPPPYKRPPIEVPPIEILPIEIEAPPFLGISGWPMAEQKAPKAKEGRGRRFLLA